MISRYISRIIIKIIIRDYNINKLKVLFFIPRRFNIPLSLLYYIIFSRNDSLSSYRLDKKEDDRVIIISLIIKLIGFIDFQYYRCLFVRADTIRI
jgi:hypothetical protein